MAFGLWAENHIGPQGTENGIELPPVTSADNGKLLGVTDGKWGKVDGSGGGGDLFVVNVTATWVEDEEYDSGGYYSCTADKTVAELQTAYDAGKNIVCKVTESYVEDEETSTYTYPFLLPLVEMSANESFMFVLTYVYAYEGDMGDMTTYTVEISETDGVSFDSAIGATLPDVSADNNGLVLTAYGGDWGAFQPPAKCIDCTREVESGEVKLTLGLSWNELYGIVDNFPHPMPYFYIQTLNDIKIEAITHIFVDNGTYTATSATYTFTATDADDLLSTDWM